MGTYRIGTQISWHILHNTKEAQPETDTTNSRIREEEQIEYVWASGCRHVGVGRR